MFRSGHLYREVLYVEHQLSLQQTATISQVSKVNDHLCRSKVLRLANEGKLYIPPTESRTLRIPMSFLVFQLFIPENKPFKLQVTCTDSNYTKFTLEFTETQEVKVLEKTVLIPFHILQMDIWNNLCIDVIGILRNCFKTNIDYLETIKLFANSRVRMIFALKFPLKQNLKDYEQVLPTHCMLPEGLYTVQVVNMEMLGRVLGFSKAEQTLIKSPNKRKKVQKRKYSGELRIYDKVIKAQLGPKLYRDCK